jgi:segregation and condensation protein A
LVATFIAVLELTRLGKLRVRQNEAYTDIECSARDETDIPILLIEEAPAQALVPDLQNPLETPLEAPTVTT